MVGKTLLLVEPRLLELLEPRLLVLANVVSTIANAGYGEGC